MSDPIVFLPDLMSDGRVFAPLIAGLSREHGIMLAPPHRFYRVEHIVSALLETLPPRVALAGHAMGGAVALEMYRRAPERVSRLALISTHPLSETPQDSAAREPQIVSARAGRLSDVVETMIQPEYLAPSAQRLPLVRLLRDMAQSLGADVFEVQSRALQRRRDQQSTLRRSKIPVTVVCGELDPVCTVKRHVSMAELAPSSQLVVIENAGHWPMLERPEMVERALQSWLRQPYAPR